MTTYYIASIVIWSFGVLFIKIGIVIGSNSEKPQGKLYISFIPYGIAILSGIIILLNGGTN